MSEQTIVSEGFSIPDAEKFVTEDDTPVDNFASEKQQRFLVSSLYSSRSQDSFIAAANVGVFYQDSQPAIVPDVFLSLDVQVPENWWKKSNRSYLVWQFGKPPEVAIEIVSDKEGQELNQKLSIYEQMRVSYYIVYNPSQQLSQTVLRLYELRGRRYFETSQSWLDQVELGVTLWQGEFEGRQDTWLRWCDQEGTILLTGDERAAQAEHRAVQAESRAQQLAEQLRSLGVNPDTV